MTATTTPRPGDIFTGRAYVNVLDPDPASFDLRDIFTALSRLPRFTGHGDRVVTVGVHVLPCLDICAAFRVTSEVRRAVLMHDAAEAYLGDVASPLKEFLPDYRAIEAKMEAAIFRRYSIRTMYRPMVRRIDRAALALEKAAIFPDAGQWPCDSSVDVPNITVGVHYLLRHRLENNTPADTLSELEAQAYRLEVIQ